ncbi:hypothetical protein MMC26_006005 [Xylographa opegraphella]|nr:hypothetical protein [Xylographa opegraphella]
MSPKFPPPPGYTVQGIDGPSNGPSMVLATVITLGFAIVAVILRMIVKCFVVPSLNWEDFFAVAALLLAIARTILLVIMTKDYQFGYHIWDTELANFGYVYTVSLDHLAGAIACAKVSILLLYIRLFHVNKPFRFTCYALISLVTTYCAAMALANIFQCNPVYAGWNFFAPGKCASLQEITVATGALNIITDVIIVVAPIVLVMKLQLRLAKMIGIIAVLATGLFVVAVAIIREVEVVNAPSLYDATWTDATRTLWLSVELHVGIICICLPLLSPLGRKIPGRVYFRDQYYSMVSLIRRSRSTSQNIQPASGDKQYIELSESDIGLGRQQTRISRAPGFGQIA